MYQEKHENVFWQREHFGMVKITIMKRMLKWATSSQDLKYLKITTYIIDDIMGIIYKATSPSQKSYVGQTRYDLSSRWRDHVYDANDPKKDHCKLLNRAIRKYGKDNFVLEVLCECDDEELNEKEGHYIKLFNTIKPHGYNLTYGGLANIHLEETKQKISEKLKGIPKPFETLEKRSKTKKQLKNSDLPMYLIETKKQGEVAGYRVTYPGFPERRFADRSVPMEVKLDMAMKYLESIKTKVAVQRSNVGGSE